jgi:hypothetical protein
MDKQTPEKVDVDQLLRSLALAAEAANHLILCHTHYFNAVDYDFASMVNSQLRHALAEYNKYCSTVGENKDG